MNAQLRDLILTRPSAAEIKKHLMQGNWHDLKAEGIRCVEKGLTSIDEMMRACFIEESSANKEKEMIAENSNL